MQSNFQSRLDAKEAEYRARIASGELRLSTIDFPGSIHEILDFDSDYNLVNLNNPKPRNFIPSEVIGVTPGIYGYDCYQPSHSNWFFEPDLRTLYADPDKIAADLKSLVLRHNIPGLRVLSSLFTNEDLEDLQHLTTLFVTLADSRSLRGSYAQSGMQGLQTQRPIREKSEFLPRHAPRFDIFSTSSASSGKNLGLNLYGESFPESIRARVSSTSYQRLQIKTSKDLPALDLSAESICLEARGTLSFGKIDGQKLQHIAISGAENFDSRSLAHCQELEYLSIGSINPEMNFESVYGFAKLKHLLVPGYTKPSSHCLNVGKLPRSLETLHITIDSSFDFASLNHLQELKALQIQLRDKPEELPSVEPLQQLPKLELLVLDGPVTNDHVDALGKLDRLKKLKILNGTWDGHGCQALAEKLEQLTVTLCRNINWSEILPTHSLPENQFHCVFVHGQMQQKDQLGEATRDYQQRYFQQPSSIDQFTPENLGIVGNPDHFSTFRRKLTNEMRGKKEVPEGQSLAHAVAETLSGKFQKALKIATSLKEDQPQNLYIRMLEIYCLSKLNNEEALETAIKGSQQLMTFWASEQYSIATRLQLFKLTTSQHKTSRGQQADKALRRLEDICKADSSKFALSKVCGTGMRHAKARRDEEKEDHELFVKASRGELEEFGLNHDFRRPHGDFRSGGRW